MFCRPAVRRRIAVRSVLFNLPVLHIIFYIYHFFILGEEHIMVENVSSNCEECPDGMVRDGSGECVMPEVTFASLVLSLNTSALFHMGELPHPETGQKTVDKALAKHTIDTLGLLSEKTKGNLDNDEGELLTRVLYELKMKFVNLTCS